MLTGKPPRQGRTLQELIHKAQNDPAPSARKANPHVSKALDAICLKAMAFRQQDRYTGAANWPRTSAATWPASRCRLIPRRSCSARDGGFAGIVTR